MALTSVALSFNTSAPIDGKLENYKKIKQENLKTTKKNENCDMGFD
jgi:hypothetical protein